MSVVVALLVWAGAGHRLLIALRHPSLLNTTYLVSLALAGSAFTLKAASAILDVAIGPLTADSIKHLLVVGMGVSLQLFVLAVKTANPTRRAIALRVGVGAVVAVGMIMFYLAAPLHSLPIADPELADNAFMEMAPIQIHLLIFHAYLTFVLVDNVRLCWRFASSTGDQGRSTNLRLVGWGSAIALIYTVSRLASVISMVVNGQALTSLDSIGSLAAMLGGICVALAVFSPQVVPWLKDWRTARLGTRRLNQLWKDLTATFPTVVLPAPGSPFAPRRAEFIFDRQLIEISECLRRVHLPYSSLRSLQGSSATRTRLLALELHRSRPSWISASGPTPADLLPPVRTTEEEAAMVLEIAEHYAAAEATFAAQAALTIHQPVRS